MLDDTSEDISFQSIDFSEPLLIDTAGAMEMEIV
jgi:hypothetical protein